MMRQNFYNEFASIYDSLMNDVDYEQWTSFIIKHLPSSTTKILEAACGTGNITSYLVDGNYNITAFDASDEMLIKAYNKLRRYRNVRFLNQDMTKFKFSSKFNACICCCDGVNYLAINEVSKFFKNVYNHLTENGLFIFDISTDYKYLNMKDIYVYDEDDVFYIWENTLAEDKTKLSMEINFFVKNEDKYQRITELQTHYIYQPQSLKILLTEIGFKNINIYDGYTENKYENCSNRATFICEI